MSCVLVLGTRPRKWYAVVVMVDRLRFVLWTWVVSLMYWFQWLLAIWVEAWFWLGFWNWVELILIWLDFAWFDFAWFDLTWLCLIWLCLLIYLLACLFTYLLACLFTYLLACLFIYLLIYLLTYSDLMTVPRINDDWFRQVTWDWHYWNWKWLDWYYYCSWYWYSLKNILTISWVAVVW